MKAGLDMQTFPIGPRRLSCGVILVLFRQQRRQIILLPGTILYAKRSQRSQTQPSPAPHIAVYHSHNIYRRRWKGADAVYQSIMWDYIVRILLFLLTIISFLPHYQQIISRNDCSGISPYYILFNLVSATHQFFLGYAYVVQFDGTMHFVHGNPRTLLDWLNFVQLTIVLLCFVTFFGLCLLCPSDQPSFHKYIATILYIIILVLYLWSQFPSFKEDRPDRGLLESLYYGVLFFYVNYFITAIGIASLLLQWRQATALSLRGLFLQAVIFPAVAISWYLFTYYDWHQEGDPKDPPGFHGWYLFVGFTAVDNAVFAVVQGILFYIAWRRGFDEGKVLGVAEAQPLLTH
ncbi:hypothetical protein QBC33DRAFT_549651 [Phialemonium atrogriseum]|uniref:Uncharacterized protein n=1 Tax=Phialemonium atrogriseum TaxID=1093897 RepID=A0AAJ0BSV5_9PEZI|nr:uncharacterized protein QBC33DRAFT_549651 [Phialemonium atrogriseum]KAK1763427.1 hypothetical protein QBC33DRAFT_549651 [Phialemonium atrogriseum]